MNDLIALILGEIELDIGRPVRAVSFRPLLQFQLLSASSQTEGARTIDELQANRCPTKKFASRGQFQESAVFRAGRLPAL